MQGCGWQKGLCLAALMLCPAGVAADVVPPPSERAPAVAADGPALLVGYGRHYGGAGLALTYAHRAESWLTLTPRLGGGFLIGMAAPEATSPFGWAAGIAAVFGTGHRGFVDVGWARGDAESVYLHGTLAASRGVSGPTGSVGYEYISVSGFVVRLGLDLFARMHPNSTLRGGTWQKSIGVGVGKELW